jgi:hypothetical protein
MCNCGAVALENRLSCLHYISKAQHDTEAPVFKHMMSAVALLAPAQGFFKGLGRWLQLATRPQKFCFFGYTFGDSALPHFYFGYKDQSAAKH